MKNLKILIIEDSKSIVEAVSLVLQIRWPDVKIVSTSSGEKGIEIADKQAPDIIILDLGLPDISGFDVLKSIRLFSNIPIIILTVRSEEGDIVKSLEWGADDYMVKPFKQLELLARIQGILRRNTQRGEETLACGNLRFNPVTQRLISGKNEVKISHTEGLILAQLMRNAGNPVSYSNLAEAMWGADFPEASESIKVHIRNLRKKLEQNPSKPKLIITKPGTGYLFAIRN
jgi:two-component system, OmpR family, response regulator VicR